MTPSLFRYNVMKKGLSLREAEVAQLAATGLTNKQIAKQLFVTKKTIGFHLGSAFKKLSIRTRSQLVAAGTEIDSPAGSTESILRRLNERDQ